MKIITTPDFNELKQLTSIIEKETIKFIEAVEEMLSDCNI